MKLAALLVLLAVPASAGHHPTYAQYPYAQFKAHVARAAEGVGLLAPPDVRQGMWPWDLPPEDPGVAAWVSPPLPIIWVNPRHLDATVDDLCDTAYHEVVHLWMAQEGEADPKDHENHAAWMAFFYVQERCYGDRDGPPEWEGEPYEDFLED